MHSSVERSFISAACPGTHTDCFSSCEQRCAPTFSLHNHLVTTGPCVLHLLHSPTTRKNSYLVGVGATYVTKSAVSRLLSVIQHSSRVCLMGNKPQNTLGFFLFMPRLHFCQRHSSRLSVRCERD